MATGRLSYDKSDETIIEGEVEDTTEIDRDADEQLQSAVTEFGGDNEGEVTIKVYKVMPGKGKMGWLFDCVPEELPILARVRDQYGAGEFCSKVYVGGKLKKVLRFIIAAKISTASDSKSGDLSEILRAMQENQRIMFEQLRDVMGQATGKTAPVDPMHQMTGMMSVMLQMKEFVGGHEKKEDSFENFLRLLEVARDFGDRGSEAGPWDVAKSLLTSPALGEAISALGKQQPALTHQPRQAAPGAQPQPQPPPQPQPQPQEGDAVGLQRMMITNKIRELVALAARGSSPQLYAELILDQVPENIIREHLLADNAINNAAELVPDVNHYRPWFEELRSELNGFFDVEESSPEPPSVGASEA